MSKRLLVGLLTAGMMAAMLPGAVAAEDYFECTFDTIEAAFTDTLVVPSYGYCTVKLADDEIRGNMIVGSKGALYLEHAVVKGDITLESKTHLDLRHIDLYSDISCSDDFLSVVDLGDDVTIYGDIDASCTVR